MKICFTANRRKGQGWLDALLDFFIPHGYDKENGKEWIRAEASTSAFFVGERLVVKRRFYTFRALVRHYWDMLLKINKALLLNPSPYVSMAGAIGLDAATLGATSSASDPVTFAHVCTGNNRFLAVGFSKNADNTISGVTYNSVAMTADNNANTGTGNQIYQYRLVNPSTGSNTVSIDFSTTGNNCSAGAISFTGVHQTSPTDGTATATGSSTTPSVGITTSVNNSWVVDAMTKDNTSASTAGADQTERWDAETGNRAASASTEPAGDAGAKTMSWTIGTTGGWGIVAMGFRPAPVAGVKSGGLTLTKVG